MGVISLSFDLCSDSSERQWHSMGGVWVVQGKVLSGSGVPCWCSRWARGIIIPAEYFDTNAAERKTGSSHLRNVYRSDFIG